MTAGEQTDHDARFVMSRSSLALDNLRGVVILIVLAFHAALAYVSWIPARTVGFDDPPYAWRAFPILDGHRWPGFDLFCAWQDVYLMALLFFLSGLFVYPSLTRKKNWGFVRDRLLRLGVPLVFGMIVLVPIAEYPAYSVTAPNPSIADYVHSYFALPFLPNGQLWFLWQLLVFDIIVGVLNFVAPNALQSFGRWSRNLGLRPFHYLALLIGISAVAYVPLAQEFTPWAWSNSGPLAVQFCRPLMNFVYFFAAVGIGAGHIDEGLIEADGQLSKHWWLWFAAALTTLFSWMGITYLTLDGPAPIAVQIASDLAFVVACAAGCAFFLATSLRFGLTRSRPLASLSANAYSLYLVHYVFSVWMQYALLPFDLPALIKALIVFAVTLSVSWVIILAVQRIPLGARLFGVRPAPIAGLNPGTA